MQRAAGGVLCLVSAIALLGGCTQPPIIVNADFRDGNEEGWEAGFADLPAGAEDQFELEARLADLPAEVSSNGTGFYIKGFNQSDDLFMFLKKRVGPDDGLLPNTTYRVLIGIRVASNAPTGCAGIGGAPGEGVTLKAGATNVEPDAINSNGTLVMNVDKGNQATGGPAASAFGNIANGTPCADVPDLENAPFVLLEFQEAHSALVTTGSDATLWVLVGTDSGYEGVTELYYQQINVFFGPVAQP